MKKTRKMSKSKFFQMSVNQSIWVQIVFWIVQKKALGIFDPNPEPHQYSLKIRGEIGIFRVRCRFLTFCKNRKNGFSSISFEESVLWTIWDVEKNLTIFSYHPKNFQRIPTKSFDNIAFYFFSFSFRPHGRGVFTGVY